MRNYWALLPAIAVCVGLLLLYAVPTLINPRWTNTVLGLFRQQPTIQQPLVQQPSVPAGPEATPATGTTGMTDRQLRSRRLLAAALVACALALVGLNVSFTREANGCYRAAKAWGAVDAKDKTDDPCIDMIYGTFFGDGTGKPLETKPQPVAAYQLVKGKSPKYVRWIQNRPSYDEADLLIGVGGNCALDLKVVQADDRITVLSDTSDPCPPDTEVSLTAIKLDKPLGDRKIVTVGDKPVQRIEPDMDSWGTVLKKLATGG